MSAELFVFLENRIPKVAAQVHKMYPFAGEREDFVQECWVRALTSTENFERDFVEHPEFVMRKLRDAALNFGRKDDRDRRARKAAYLGYHPDDEYTYTPLVIGVLLAELIPCEFNVPEAVVKGSRNAKNQEIRVQTSQENHDQAVDYEVMLIDVKDAYMNLRPKDQQALYDWYQAGSNDEEAKREHEQLAASMGLSYSGFRSRMQRAREALTEQLHHTKDELEEIHGGA